ncbi:hypothetical protein Phi17:1_gp21 [Cellulophaga phage phi17:1]|uniref:Uncharacterized protein n=1 Tax=Cellulophaga phage phi17:1 TaxID=1327980 RepID=S0A1E4_9CAUD|nr:hypothetical protein Phi17:1_gp21 [Cellulophaga phage phi17:1]AGO48297.1 hypothetical protein Phi17:1_gp21 [Cellulophaga phage phi17:1]
MYKLKIVNYHNGSYVRVIMIKNNFMYQHYLHKSMVTDKINDTVNNLIKRVDEH